VQSFQDGSAAVEAALLDALRDGAIAGVSPAVQAALRRYGSDLNRSVAEAVKVQDLEELLESRENPFASAFRDFERQARDRLKLAREYGFEVVEIERLNAEERARLIEDTLNSTVRSARDLLDELRFGSRAEGSPVDRLAALSAERSRLLGLFDAGDRNAGESLARIIEQQLDVAEEAFGTAGNFAGIRADAVSALERIVAQAEGRIAQASLEAQRATVEKLTEANTSLDEQVLLLQQQNGYLQQLVAAYGGASIGGRDSSLYQRPALP
jgi:hypothetical protein